MSTNWPAPDGVTSVQVRPSELRTNVGVLVVATKYPLAKLNEVALVNAAILIVDVQETPLAFGQYRRGVGWMSVARERGEPVRLAEWRG